MEPLTKDLKPDDLLEASTKDIKPEGPKSGEKPDQNSNVKSKPRPSQTQPPFEQLAQFGIPSVSPAQAPANSPSPSPSATTTDNRPGDNRKGNRDDNLPVVDQGVPTGDLQIPGVTKGGDEKDSSLKIKIHLNLHAKVRLDLDAQIYGDVVIGLL
ncbi:hypothetical protein N7492_007997 [Penicillium capsulatum]|uniref:Uncharacterized protein n=1 Tax=Penicillium capsulatum TaxID=69766 RepID=A0A9W9HUC6_9EURO|nr:hypothetical protein N7492_007997 [Penicillium capsulatum]KAJ6105404.1 hypothetical protein N7512_008921 [Penicillium capsulatum]